MAACTIPFTENLKEINDAIYAGYTNNTPSTMEEIIEVLDLTNDVLSVDKTKNKYVITPPGARVNVATVDERVSSLANKVYKRKGGEDKTHTDDTIKQMEFGTTLHAIGHVTGVLYNEVKKAGNNRHYDRNSKELKKDVEVIAKKLFEVLNGKQVPGISNEIASSLTEALKDTFGVALNPKVIIDMLHTTMGVIDDIYAEQLQLDPNALPEIRFEQKLMDLTLEESLAGTGDIVVFYSDMSIGYVDYKTYSPTSKYTDNIEVGHKEYQKVVTRKNSYQNVRLEKWRVTVPAYESILLKRYGGKFVRTSRIVPIASFWNASQEVVDIFSNHTLSDAEKVNRYAVIANRGQTRGNTVTGIETMYTEIPAGMTKKLTNVIISSEVLANEALQTFVNRRIQQILDLEDAKNKAKTSEARVIISKKITEVNDMMNNIVLLHNLIPTLEYLENLLEKAKVVLAGNEEDPEAESIDDPEERAIKLKYNRVNRISGIRDELKYYSQLNAIVNSVLSKSNNISPQNKTDLMYKTALVTSRIEVTQSALVESQYNALTELGAKIGVPNKAGKILFEDDGFLQFHTQGASNSNNPFFNELHKRVAMIDVKSTKDFEVFLKDSATVFDGLSDWMSRNNWNEKKFRDFFVNPKTGNLNSIYNPNVRDAIEAEQKKALLSKDPKFFVDNFKIKDGWAKSYALRFKNQVDVLREEFLEDYVPGTDKYKEKARKMQSELAYWALRNNFHKSTVELVFDSATKAAVFEEKVTTDVNKTAWLNNKNVQINTEWTEKFKERFYTDSYKFMQKNKELLDWYNFWTTSMKEAREIFGIFDNSVLPLGFIPNILNEMVTSIRDAGVVQGVQTSLKMGFAHLKLNNDDVIEYQDGNGNIIRNIPVPYLHPFKTTKKNDDGTYTTELDPGAKSYDMQRVLTEFMRAAFAHRYKVEEAGILYALKHTMEDYSEVYQTDKAGILDKNARGEPITTKISGSVSKAFDDYTAMYINGKRITDKDISIKGYSMQKGLMAAQNLFAKKVLGWNLYAPIAAYFAGAVGVRISAKKGTIFTKKHHTEAIKLKGQTIGTSFRSDTTVAKKVKMFLYRFDPYTQSHFKHAGWKVSKRSAIEKFLSDRTAFIAFEYADDLNVDVIALSMAQAYGIDKNNKLRHLSNIEDPNAKSLWELFNMQESGDEDVKTNVLNNNGVPLTEDELDDILIAYRSAVQEVQKGIMGTQSERDKSLYSSRLLGAMMGMFRNWIPNLINEMVKPLAYNRHTDVVDIGRFTSIGHAASDMIKTSPDTKKTWKDIALGIAKISMFISVDLIPFINLTQSKLQKDQDSAKAWFEVWKQNHPQLAINAFGEPVTFEQYQRAKINQVNTLISQIRILALMMMLMMFAGGDWDDDGKPDYRKYWVGRQAYRIFSRIWSESASMYSFTDFNRLIGGGGLPVWSLVVDLSKLLGNTLDETRDLLIGENDPKDSTPMFYYTIDWIPLLSRLRKIFELSQNDYKSTR